MVSVIVPSPTHSGWYRHRHKRHCSEGISPITPTQRIEQGSVVVFLTLPPLQSVRGGQKAAVVRWALRSERTWVILNKKNTLLSISSCLKLCITNVHTFSSNCPSLRVSGDTIILLITSLRTCYNRTQNKVQTLNLAMPNAILQDGYILKRILYCNEICDS